MNIEPDFPSLPDDMSAVGGAIWAANAVLSAGLERRWDPALMRQTLFALSAMVAISHEPSDAKLIAEFTAALQKSRAGRLDN